MKTLYTFIFLLAVFFTANSQSRIADMKWKNNFNLRMSQSQNAKSSSQPRNLKNTYWENINAPHLGNSYSPQVKVATPNSVWTHVGFFDSLGDNTKWFLRTADGGKTWRFDTIPSPQGYVIGSIAPVDGNTCYASMFNLADINGYGGGIFKTINGGATWKQIGIGQLFKDSTFIDFVYFFDARHGLTIGDGKGSDSSHLRIYTTSDAGTTWERVPDKNIPPTTGTAYSFPFNVYAVSKNRIWFRGYDSYGNSYVYRSDDLGHSLQLFSFPGEIFDYAFSDKSNGVAIGYDENGKFVAVSHDGGETFEKIAYSGDPKDFFITAIPGPNTFVTTGIDEGRFGSSYSNDYGATWHVIDSGVVHTDVEFLNLDIGWTGEGFIPADQTGGMFKWKLHFSLKNNELVPDNDASISSVSKNNFSNTIDARLSPNPARDVLKIDGLVASSKTTLSLYNISGTLIQQSITTGSNYSFNLQHLMPGNYYITIRSNENINTLKFVKE